MKSPPRRLALISAIAALLASVTAPLQAAPAITSVAINPSVPTNTDAVTVTANVQPTAGSALSQVQLNYSTGGATGTVFRETMNTNQVTTAWTGSGALNPWTVTAVRAGGDVQQRFGNANHTVPTVLTNCTTNGTTLVTCNSTALLWPGMSINGTNISAGSSVASITNATTFVLSTPATGSGTGLSLTAAGVTLTNCTTTTGSPNVSCASTAGLLVGMALTGTGVAPNPSVLSITDANNFVLNANITTGASGLTLTGSDCGLQFSNGTVNYTDTMVATTNPINLGNATASYVEFYVRTSDFVSNNGWTMQVSPDGGTTWNTRTSESYAANTIGLTNCTLNGTTTVTCASTTGLAAGMTVQGLTLPLTNCGTTNTSALVTCANTTGLAVGTYLTGNGIPANTRVLSIVPNTSFTMSANATATATVSVLANYLNAGTTIASVTNTNSTTFVLSAAPVYTGSGLALNATTINHGFILEHYNLTAAEMTGNMKLRFQFSGYVAAPPARIPVCNIDDVIVVVTASAVPVTVAMFDDGAHGDGLAGDGVFGAVIPAFPTGTAVTYSITATDSLGGSTTSNSGSYTVVAAAPSLAVTPTAPLTASGTAGGPFTPSSITYSVSNNGVGAMNWTASNTTNWLTLSSSGGTLAAGASASVTATINPNANSLPGGNYNETVTFTNTSNGVGNATSGVALTVYSIPAAPVLPTTPSFGRGTTQTISWAAITGAASYTLQISNSASFATVLSSQTVTSPSASFLNLADGGTYYYRVLATNPAGSSSYSNIATVTQDATPPSIAITAPNTGATTATASITVTGTSSDSGSGVASVIVNNVPATTSNGFATWSATVPLGFGTNAIKATATDNAGNFTTTAPVLVTLTTAQTYNPLFIPDTMTGTTFNLTLDQSTKQYFPGPATTVYGYNRSLFWGPTLIMKQGDFVQINLTNNLVGTTTTHWHGFHIPAIMDGGPHETIPAGTVWSPSFYVKNSAGTYWYHPHLHPLTEQQLTLGAGGMIIVQDPVEAALPLPRTYGVDDIPVVLTSRRFVAGGGGANQFQVVSYGDYPLVNGTLSAQVNLPAQVVRLRILNAEIQRSHYLGFSDNRTFYVMATDGGLVNTPVPVTRLQMAVAERYEILVNLTGVTPGTTLDLKTYNSVFATTASYPGGPGGTTPPTGSLLNGIDYTDLHINVVSPTANPITSIPTTLANNVYWTTADVTNNRTVNITGAGGAPLAFDNLVYSPSVINETLNLNAIEQWTVTNLSGVSHSFHIHDVQFYTTAFSGGVPANMQGWKDTIYVQQGTSVSFIAKFDGFASNTNPYMFHCHFLNHEDAGLMGQFLVQNNAVEDLAIASFTRVGSDPSIHLQFQATPGTTYTVQYSPDMTTSSWVDVGSVTSDGASADFLETNLNRLALARGFYRVAIPVITQ